MYMCTWPFLLVLQVISSSELLLFNHCWPSHPKVLPTMQQYELDTFGRSHDVMSNFWNSCFDDLMSTAFKRDKDRSDSKSKFQVALSLHPLAVVKGFCIPGMPPL